MNKLNVFPIEKVKLIGLQITQRTKSPQYFPILNNLFSKLYQEIGLFYYFVSWYIQKNKKFGQLFCSLAVLIIIIVNISIVNAFGATSPYWSERPLVMSPGETKIFPIMLQNMVGEKDIALKGEIVSDFDIASFTDNSQIYQVPFGKEDIKADIKVEIPPNAKKGDKYKISFIFTEIKSGDNEMLKISSGSGNSFNVIIDSEENLKESPSEVKNTISSSQESNKMEITNQESPKKSLNHKILFYILITIISSIILIIIAFIFIIIKNSNKEKFLNNPSY